MTVEPKRGLAALEDLYAPFTANITLHIGKYTFRAHREYLVRSPLLARDIPPSTETLRLNLPVPSKFMDMLTFLYVGGGPALLTAFHEGLFTPSNFLDTLRNAAYLELDEIVLECYKRFHRIWRDVFFLDAFSIESLSPPALESLLDSTTPPFTTAEKALLTVQWSSPRPAPAVIDLIQKYSLSGPTDPQVYIDIGHTFSSDKRPMVMPMVFGRRWGSRDGETGRQGEVTYQRSRRPRSRSLSGSREPIRDRSTRYQSLDDRVSGPQKQTQSSGGRNGATAPRQSYPPRQKSSRRTRDMMTRPYKRPRHHFGSSDDDEEAPGSDQDFKFEEKENESSEGDNDEAQDDGDSESSRGRSRSVRPRSPMYSPSQTHRFSEDDEEYQPTSPQYYPKKDEAEAGDGSPYYYPTSPSYSPMSPVYTGSGSPGDDPASPPHPSSAPEAPQSPAPSGVSPSAPPSPPSPTTGEA